MDEAEENNLGDKAINARWARWDTCSLCKQEYQGVVKCALGWACWKTYVGRPETDRTRMMALSHLATAYQGPEEEKLRLLELALEVRRRIWPSDMAGTLREKSQIAHCYEKLGRHDEALVTYRDIYQKTLALFGEVHYNSFLATDNLARSLVQIATRTQQMCLQHEAMQLLQERIPQCERALGPGHSLVFNLQEVHMAIVLGSGPSAADLRACEAMYKERVRSTRRTYGPSHEWTRQAEKLLENVTLALSVGVARGYI